MLSRYKLFRYITTKHKMIRCPSKTSEAVVVLRFSLVELSRRRAVLLRGGPRRKGRVESHVHLPLLSLHFGATHRYHSCAKN